MSFPEAAPPNSGVPQTRVKPGDVIAEKYEVERVLAAGGMGVVLAAHHRQLKRRVALKFLLPELCETPGIVARFLREAQAMTTIQNEHVARVLDVGTTKEGSPFMVMEYLEGEDLSQTLERRGRLPPHEAIEYVLQGMEALAEAHVNGFVHRDLKPSNLFITHRPDGAALVKVLDFGISKTVAKEDQEVNLTHTRGMLGSPLYMAPEQIRSSKSVDTRADIWTLGIILHELITGRSPFDADNVAAVLAAIVADEPPSLQSMRPDVPRGLSEVVLRCLSRNRDDRYGTVADLATALAPFAPPDARVSIERIQRTVLHNQQRMGTADLKAKTMPRGDISPMSSSLASTAAAPPTSAPQPSSPVIRTSPKTSSNSDTTFGKYKLIAILGTGGMADVYLAVLDGPEGFGFSKLVVIKRLRASMDDDREFVSMLVDEARIAAKLNHPNVVQTHEVGIVDERPYIAMEYLQGQALNRILQRAHGPEPMTLAFRLGVVRDLLAGIHHAHELTDFDGTPMNLVHRDVTPQNVFVTYEGQVKVVDFGIAKAKGRATETAQGVLKGKVRYMAPEQAGGQEMDRRTDVFAAGVMLWELLTGERMWKGLEDVAIIQKLLLDKIPSSPRAVNPQVPKALDAIVRRALSKKKEDRYATAEEFQLDIERFMDAEGLKCNARELGGWVARLFADRQREARSLVEGQLAALRSASGTIKLLKLRESSPSGGAPDVRMERMPSDAVVDDSSSRAGVLARSHPGASTTGATQAPPRSRALLVVAGAALVVLVALGIGVLVKTRADAKPANDPMPSHTTASSTPSAGTSQATIAVHLSASTPGATFFIDKEGPFPAGTFQRRRDDANHLIEASAPGYRTQVTQGPLFAKGDYAWAPPLEPDATKVEPTTKVASPTGHGPVPSSRSAVTATKSAEPVATAAPTTSSNKRVRTLDSANPYGEQQQPPQ